jgi:kumamolisin
MTQPVDPTERVEVTLILRPRRPLPELAAQAISREEFAAEYGADPSDVARVKEFAAAHHLAVVETSVARRTVRLAGRAADISLAFGVRLHRQQLADGTSVRVPDHEVSTPRELQGVVSGIFGLDTRPVARRRG